MDLSRPEAVAGNGPPHVRSGGGEHLDAAKRLHRYLVNQHWAGDTLVGPDPGIRLNARAGRFVKSYLPFVAWSDQLTYIQAQAYWIMDNWLLYEITGEDRYCGLALAGSDSVLDRQLPAGYWEYPNPEWRGRIATVEGCFGALGLVDSYEHSGDARYLEGALAWHAYMSLGVGFRSQPEEGMLAVNYFAHLTANGGGVPNNSTLVLWLVARLYEITGNDSYLELAAPLVRWLAHVQLESGELPYSVGWGKVPDRPHYLCQQYNAFEFMDLVHYFGITEDESVLPMMEKLAGFLSHGFTAQGFARYDCKNDEIEVIYYTAAVAQALSQATRLGLGDYSSVASDAYGRVIGQQRSDGGFRFHSRGNYRFLVDRRSYPRYLAMILHHLLLAHRATAEIGESQ